MMDIARYTVYITTNPSRSVLTTGVTGDLSSRLFQLQYGLLDEAGGLSKDDCSYLVYWESFEDVKLALTREAEIERLSFKRKKALIDDQNPGWRFLNEDASLINVKKTARPE